MAGQTAYSPVDRVSMSADESGQSLLSQDEKSFVFERCTRAQRFYHHAIRGFILLFLLFAHAGLVLLLARWVLFSVPMQFGAPPKPMDDMGGMTHGHGHGHGHGSGGYKVAEDMDSHVRYTLEGVPPSIYKDPSAEFSMVNPCGSTAAEAKARGCRFGVLYGAWLPQECWDDETEERFRSFTDWKFYLQPNRTQEITWDEVAQGEHEYVLVEWLYHQRHCAEMGRRFFTAISRRGLHTIDSYLSQWAHTDHCAHAIMESNPDHQLMAILQRKFPDCGLIRWKN